ncbi:MAG: Outer rane efflux protein [Verrucomicrobiaceae bacterium]|nr:Outer rane efflux protein [Verrucomicrobiaceae bacterium]
MRLSVILFTLSLATLAMADKPRALSLKQAHEAALQKHPKITVSELKALAAKQVVKQAQSAFFPTIIGNLGAAVAADPNTRVVSGILPLSSVFDRASASVVVSQLITDFGRSAHLEQSAKLKAGAERENVEATRAQILLQVDGAYMSALQAQALVDVAQQTVKTRKLLRDQVVTLAKNQLKSDLDASFAEVNYQEALLLQSKSENDLQASFATLAALLDERQTTAYLLTDHPTTAKAAGNVSELISEAMNNRPDLKRLRLERDSAWKFAKAEGGLRNPTLSMQGTAGVLPYRDKALADQNYAAGGIALSIPIFTGGLYTARQKEAELRAQAADASLRDEETGVIRDVRIAWINLNNARERTAITAELLTQAGKSQDLADARYNAGTTSMVELGQAQLSFTSAQINETTARYEFLVRRSLLDYQIGNLR